MLKVKIAPTSIDLDPNKAWVLIIYSADSPDPNVWGIGTIRLWKKPGDQPRDNRSALPDLYAGEGDWIAPGFYTNLGELTPSGTASHEMTFYIEGVNPSGTLGDTDITFWLDPDGEGPAGFVHADTVQVTVFSFALAECPETWLPTGGSEDSTIDITALVQGPLAETIRFTLESVSAYPGYCMNAPSSVPSEGEDSPGWRDLQFPEQEGFIIYGDHRNVAETTSHPGGATVTVKSYDYAAWGALKAEALIGGVWYQAVVPTTRDFWITLPLDHDLDFIADSWEQAAVQSWNLQYGPEPPVPADQHFFANLDDKEERDPDGAGPLGTHAAVGDGYAVFAEYRGFAGTDSSDANKHARLSPVRKELLIEIDIMEQQPEQAGGATTGVTTSKSESMIWYEDAGWTPGALVGMKVNPDTAQNLRFVIMSNTADTLTVYGDMSVAGPLAQQTTFQIARTQPPAPGTIDTVMGSVALAYLNTAGVKLHWIIDDTSGPRVPWRLFAAREVIEDWLDSCRDEGRRIDAEHYEDRYQFFTHLAFCDYNHENPRSAGATANSFKGSVIFTFVAEEVAKTLGVTTEQALTMITAHELGHVVRCDHDSYGETAFEIAYVGAGLDSTIEKTGLHGLYAPVWLYGGPTGTADFTYDLLSSSYRTIGHVVQAIDDHAAYQATLTNPNAGQLSLYLQAAPLVLQKDDPPSTCLCHIDDYIMIPFYSHDAMINPKFHQSWPHSIPIMDVAGRRH
jgi:hypothetical protein